MIGYPNFRAGRDLRALAPPIVVDHNPEGKRRVYRDGITAEKSEAHFSVLAAVF